MINQEVSERLIRLRKDRRLSLRALSRKTGIAASFISALERGETSVSVAKLKMILDGLGTTLGAFFAGPEPQLPKIVYHKEDLVEIAGLKDGISLREVAAGRPGRMLQFILETYKPGANTGPELYTHDAEEAGVVLKGKMELVVGKQKFVLGPGDAYYFSSRLPHGMRNMGRTKAEVISVNSPPSF